MLVTGSLSDRYWVHEAHPFLWEFSPGIGIRYYGLAYILGFLIGYWLLNRYTKAGRSPLTVEQNGDFFFALLVGVMAGGRIGFFLLYQPSRLFTLDLFRVWDGGMASHGGFLGVLVALLWFARQTKAKFWTLADLAATITAPGLLLGRIANFINGELWGKVTDVPWAMIFPLSDPGMPVDRIQPRHPSQLYEAALEGLLLLLYTQWRFWRSDTAKTRPGQITGEFLIGYAIVRVFCEFFREPDLGIEPIARLSRGTFYSLVMLAGGLAIWARSHFARARPEAPGSH